MVSVDAYAALAGLRETLCSGLIHPQAVDGVEQRAQFLHDLVKHCKNSAQIVYLAGHQECITSIREGFESIGWSVLANRSCRADAPSASEVLKAVETMVHCMDTHLSRLYPQKHPPPTRNDPPQKKQRIHGENTDSLPCLCARVLARPINLI